MGPMMHDKPFPKGPLVGAGLLVGGALLAAVAGRLGAGDPGPPPSDAVAARELRFEDRPDGAIAVLDAAGAPVAVAEPGTNGFLRGALRGLARERKRRDFGPEAPFRLTAWADGRLTLDDTATSRRLELGAFGPTNAAVFARLLTARAPGDGPGAPERDTSTGETMPTGGNTP